MRYLRNRSNIIQKLIRAAIEAKSPTPVDATGLPLEVSESVFAVHAAIRRGLYELRPGSTRERQHYQKWVDLRRSTVTDMSVLLGYDAAVVTVKQRGETLTECARRWKVVDVFEEALNQAGYDARLLAGIDIKPTESCEENFPTNNNATPSSFGAWGAAPIGPSTIAVYLEFPNISGNSCLEELSWEVPNDRLQPYLREPGLTSLCCDISRRGEELCVDIHEGSSNKEEDDLFNPRNSDTEFWRGEGSVDDGMFVKVLKAAGYLLSVIY